jgi:hypothetical protein
VVVLVICVLVFTVFCIYLRTNSYLCHLQHKLICSYNRDEKCLQRATDWVFKYSGLRFVFKGLKYKKLVYKYFHRLLRKKRSNKDTTKVLFNECLKLVSLFCYLLTSMIKDKHFYENFITENLH